MLRSHGNTRAGTNMFYFLLKSQGEAVLDSDAHMFREYLLLKCFVWREKHWETSSCNAETPRGSEELQLIVQGIHIIPDLHHFPTAL